jgi:hypothetical protein
MPNEGLNHLDELLTDNHYYSESTSISTERTQGQNPTTNLPIHFERAKMKPLAIILLALVGQIAV